MALSNVGFVNRAQKDLAAGQYPVITEQDDGGIDAQLLDGHRVLFRRQISARCELQLSCQWHVSP